VQLSVRNVPCWEGTKGKGHMRLIARVSLRRVVRRQRLHTANRRNTRPRFCGCVQEEEEWHEYSGLRGQIVSIVRVSVSDSLTLRYLLCSPCPFKY